MPTSSEPSKGAGTTASSLAARIHPNVAIAMGAVLIIVCAPLAMPVRPALILELLGAALLFSVSTAHFGRIEGELQRARVLGAQRLAALERATHSERALVVEKDRLAVALRNIGEGVVTTDLEGRVILMNGVAESMSGWSSIAAEGRLLNQILPVRGRYSQTPCGHPVDDVIRAGSLAEGRRITISKADGAPQLIERSATPIRDIDGKPTGIVWVLRDVTDVVHLERERQKAKKLESIGVLAGGIAHDFNNLLTAVMTNLSLAQLAQGLDEETALSLTEAQRACLRAKALTHQLLTFAKGGAPVKVAASISELIRDCTVFALRGLNTTCEFQIAQDLWHVEADIGQIGQVIHNVVLNAHQAMPSGGTIRIQASNVVLDESAAKRLALQPGRYAVLSFADEGAGISEENLIKIFDPYFTTKTQGNGLGLATVYSIMKAHGGHVGVESTLGSGSRFTMHIPAAVREATTQAGTRKQAMQSDNSGRILVMDDEEAIRDVVTRLLRRIGYDAEVACDGAEAIQRFLRARTAGRPFDLVLMDLTIPGGMGGLETIAELLKIDPDVKAIVSSGYTDSSIMGEFQKHGFSGVLAKPFVLEELREAIDRITSTA